MSGSVDGWREGESRDREKKWGRGECYWILRKWMFCLFCACVVGQSRYIMTFSCGKVGSISPPLLHPLGTSVVPIGGIIHKVLRELL